MASTSRSSPRLGEICGHADIWALAAWATLLHDLGKAGGGFQAMLRGGAAFDHRHEVLSLVCVGWLSVDEEALGLVAAAVATHHRDFDDVLTKYPFGGRARGELIAELSPENSETLWLWLRGEASNRLAEAGFSPLPSLERLAPADAIARSFRSLCTLGKLIGEDDARMPKARTTMALRGLLTLADHAGSAGVQMSDIPEFSTVAGATTHLGSVIRQNLMKHQEASAAADGNTLLIAPTGSGKTEAALLWWARQRERTSCPAPLFYVLPYRASLNAMYRRFLDRYALSEVLVVATTVARAQDLFRTLASSLGGDLVSLLHGRFTSEDRANKEADLAASIGTGQRNANTGGRVLVATQVVEVSLDIDFDVLFSDPAPIEALIQRFGRVNRGRRGGERDVIVFTQVEARTSGVYEPEVVDRAVAVLRGFTDRHARVVEEEHVQGWVDDCYAPIAEDFVARTHAAVDRITETVIAVNRPLNSNPELREKFFEDFNGREVVPMGLRTEYERRLDEEPLLAGFLHVPISNGQYHRLRKAGRIVDKDFVDVPYDECFGLDLTFPDDHS